MYYQVITARHNYDRTSIRKQHACHDLTATTELNNCNVSTTHHSEQAGTNEC